ncbi:putative staphylococcal-like nuclease CAN1 [Cocos nucifera]|uniref:Putative staphylococcal-like nuclease CAN1 n=1 Tax=Cocos nucifera TaxID=13894 RepID=A0A8K0MZY1_COCNU|nr:putative staphylococcal-like nuclease CAN1 [Cocos nucifera]
MPYGKEAKDEVIKLIQGKSLQIHAYEDDQCPCQALVGADAEEKLNYVTYDQFSELAVVTSSSISYHII